MTQNITAKPSRNKILQGMISLLGLLYSIWRAIKLFLDNLNLFDAREFSQAVVNLVENFAMLLLYSVIFAAVILGMGMRRGDSTREKAISPITNRIFRLPGFLLVGILFCCLIVIIVVNPRGLYGFSFFPQLYDNIRLEKVEYYKELPKDPELIIIGTSRTLSISPEYIEDVLGYRAFNFGISGPRLDDSMLVANFIFNQSKFQHPEVILFEVGGVYRINPERTALVSPLQFIPYMDSKMMFLSIETRIQELFSIYQLSEALYVLQSVKRNENIPSYWTVTPRGYTIFQPPYTLKEDLDKIIETGSSDVSCPDKENKEASEAYILKLVSLGEEHNVSILFYISPLHPLLYDKYVETRLSASGCHNDLLDFFTSLAKEHEHVYFQNFLDIHKINGITDETGFFDRQHLTPINANLLIDALAETIHQAFQRATEW